MSLKSWYSGTVHIEFSGSSIERFINICNHNGIKFYELKFTATDGKAVIIASDFKKLRNARRITGMHIRLKKKCGLPFIIHKYRAHYFFLFGIFLFFIINICLSKYLWKINFNGNVFYSDEVIMDCLNECNVRYGSKIDNVSCYLVERYLREKLDKITFVSCDIKGATFTVTIVENDDPDTEVKAEGPHDIVAAKDGIIESIITRKGTPIVKAGDSVKAGDILVMSKVEALNESDQCFATEYIQADSDIMLRTVCSYNDEIERNYNKKIYTGRQKMHAGIRISDTEVHFDLFKCGFELYDTYTDYSSLNISDSIKLPITYAYRYYLEYTLTPSEYSDEELNNFLTEHINQYIADLEENSVQITDNGVKIELYENKATATGNISVIEPAVKKQDPIIEPETSDGETVNERN